MDLTPAEQADIDQKHAGALADLTDLIEEARQALALHGPIRAPLILAEVLLADAEVTTPDQVGWLLSGTAALALIELARRDAPTELAATGPHSNERADPVGATLILAWDSLWCPACSARSFRSAASCCGRPMLPVRLEMHSRESP